MNPIAFVLVQAAARDAVRGAGPDPASHRTAPAPTARRRPRLVKEAPGHRTTPAARPAVERSG
jgi:hypothetical protein